MCGCLKRAHTSVSVSNACERRVNRAHGNKYRCRACVEMLVHGMLTLHHGTDVFCDNPLKPRSNLNMNTGGGGSFV